MAVPIVDGLSGHRRIEARMGFGRTGKPCGMALQPDTDQRLDRTSGRLAGNGAKLLALGLTLYVVAAILLIASISNFIGFVCLALGTPPTIAAIALLLSGAVGHRASQQKPFA
jgi:hypothetical protein